MGRAGGEEEMQEVAEKLQHLRTSHVRFLHHEEVGKEKKRCKDRRR